MFPSFAAAALLLLPPLSICLPLHSESSWGLRSRAQDPFQFKKASWQISILSFTASFTPHHLAFVLYSLLNGSMLGVKVPPRCLRIFLQNTETKPKKKSKATPKVIG
jgi:hypothetical protein